MSYQLKCEFEDPWLQGATSKGTHLQGLLGQLKNELSIKVWFWGYSFARTPRSAQKWVIN
jgi:hypothetical protein